MINGVVLAYSDDASGGVIKAHDGKRVFFRRKDWQSATPPCTGQSVLLKHHPDGRLQVYFESDPRTKIAA